MAAERHEAAFIVGAVVGSVAGAIYGLLNAPQAGWRTRADLSGYLEELGDRAAARVSAVTMGLQAIRGDRGFEQSIEEPWPATYGGTEPGVSAEPADSGAGRAASQFGSEGVTGR